MFSKWVWPWFWILSEKVSLTARCQTAPWACSSWHKRKSAARWNGSTAFCCSSLLWGYVSAECCCSLASLGLCNLLGITAWEEIPVGHAIFYNFLFELKHLIVQNYAEPPCKYIPVLSLGGRGGGEVKRIGYLR